MRRFVWRLQRILDIKEKEEQKVRAELFKLTEEIIEMRGELLTRQKMLEAIINGLAEENPKTRLGKQEFLLKYSATNDDQIRKLKEQIHQLETQQKEKIAEVLKVRRFKRGLERLRVETKRRYVKGQERLEQKEFDEGAQVSFVRKRMKLGERQ
jgi:flagellar FliJ protein